MNTKVELPKKVDLDDLLQKLRVLSWGAADILKAYAKGEKPPYGFPQALNVQEGGDGPVSAADLAVNSWLINGLNSNFPLVSWTVVSEETAKEQIVKGVPIEDEWIWILDPLDGTKDFLQKTGEYAVHLALVKSNEPILGVVLIPELEELWIGLIGSGSWCEDRLGNKKPFSFSDRDQISEMILVSSRNHRDGILEDLLERIPFAEKKAVGSIGCKIAKILKGEADFYLSLSGKSAPKDWDIAAPEIILKAAGGKFTHANNKAISYNTGDINQWGCIVASHGRHHEELCKTIQYELLTIDQNILL
ncbi:3'(2'),5'-bisphosphate nucleotidase [Prochlorococcus sp. MIT 0602]|nr:MULTISPECIES: 3'(2'),5'-bisphosphate nucleotidase CysQ [unclassified Prochlorococcus]KGG16362.1 3'(2'),5'-bisphosphate nucleotidase [Prochlorococcus sp. MIT 0603]KGG17904.1 3'(2'),5'-bisphosphate nucleotidase [Prochlorococcus sp. MIT 0602]